MKPKFISLDVLIERAFAVKGTTVQGMSTKHPTPIPNFGYHHSDGNSYHPAGFMWRLIISYGRSRVCESKGRVIIIRGWYMCVWGGGGGVPVYFSLIHQNFTTPSLAPLSDVSSEFLTPSPLTYVTKMYYTFPVPSPPPHPSIHQPPGNSLHTYHIIHLVSD